MTPTKTKPAEGLLIGLLGAKPKSKSEPKSEPEETEVEETESEETESEDEPDWELMGQEVLDAIQSKDASGLADAIRAMVEACEEAR